MPKRGTYYVQTWGCQMNEEDSEQLALALEGIGFRPADSWLSASVVLLNTCSVRKKPEDKAFSFLGELALRKKRDPSLVIGVCGCMAQLRAKEIKARAPHVDFVLGTGQISLVSGLVEETLLERRFRTRLDLPERKGAIVTEVPNRLVRQEPNDRVENDSPKVVSKVKAFVPIQYGCDKFCTFCIVPTTRGRERSRPTDEIISEVGQLVTQGVKEVTLLGQTVNSYGKNLAEGRVPFSKLLYLLGGISGLERIRYTSPYPKDFRADLIECIAENPKVMEHVHLPLQSGDNAMLKTMKRLYSVEDFLAIVDQLRRAVPNIGITTDIIVGYPGETVDQFEMTLEAVRNVRFDGAYMFIYSPRPGTPAAEMDQIPYPEKLARLKVLADLQNRISMEKNELWIGRTAEVLVEGPSPKDPSIWQGFSREFKMVHFPAESNVARGDLVSVKLEKAHLWGLSGSVG